MARFPNVDIDWDWGPSLCYNVELYSTLMMASWQICIRLAGLVNTNVYRTEKILYKLIWQSTPSLYIYIYILKDSTRNLVLACIYINCTLYVIENRQYMRNDVNEKLTVLCRLIWDLLLRPRKLEVEQVKQYLLPRLNENISDGTTMGIVTTHCNSHWRQGKWRVSVRRCIVPA